jgi:hypothetical protein
MENLKECLTFNNNCFLQTYTTIFGLIGMILIRHIKELPPSEKMVIYELIRK